MLGLLLWAAQAATGVSAPVQCEIITDKAESETLLIGVCGGKGVILGSATSFESALNAETGAAVAVIKRDEETRVLMVHADSDGNAMLENITGDLAMKNGRSVQAGLGDLAVDLSRFAEEGLVVAASSGTAARGLALTEAGGVSASAFILTEAERLALPKGEPTVMEVVPEGRGPDAQ
jgi:hypothetical protein